MVPPYRTAAMRSLERSPTDGERGSRAPKPFVGMESLQRRAVDQQFLRPIPKQTSSPSITTVMSRSRMGPRWSIESNTHRGRSGMFRAVGSIAILKRFTARNGWSPFRQCRIAPLSRLDPISSFDVAFAAEECLHGNVSAFGNFYSIQSLVRRGFLRFTGLSLAHATELSKIESLVQDRPGGSI